MCGISCSIRLNGAPHVNGHSTGAASIEAQRERTSIELDKSLELIKHRGPDARGQWISDDARIALGHVRLAIKDLSEQGIQPLHDPEQSVHAVVNGEIYEYDKIRAELEATSGYAFKGRSDSELVVALYKYHGQDFFRFLRGEFAFVLYDVQNQTLLAARDRYGIKPLYWTIQDGVLLIASEIKAFLPMGWKAAWDVRSILDAGWSNDHRTMFEGVHKIRPGCFVTCQSLGELEHKQYWDLEYPDKNAIDKRTPEEMILEVRKQMQESIRMRLDADVPVGVWLSGGIDSSVIAGMVADLVKHRGVNMGSIDPKERISCFTIAFDADSGHDESEIATRTADWLGVKLYKKHMDEAALANAFEEATWHSEHHSADLNFVGKYALSQLTRDLGVTVSLTGEGADETFAGYPGYLPDFLREPDRSWPGHVELDDATREQMLEATETAVKQYYIKDGADAGSLDKSKMRAPLLNGISTVSSMTAFQVDVFAPWTSAFGKIDPKLTIANNVDGRTRKLIQDTWHPLHTAEYVWSKGHLANIFLTSLGDRMEMAHSIEARTPFLDHKLTEYVNRLPPSIKIKWNPETRSFTEKWILREASRPFITKEVYERRKHPYSAPVSYPPNGPLQQLLNRTITRANIAKLGFIDWTKCEKLVVNAFENRNSKALRYAFIVAQWVILGQRFGVATARRA